MFKSFVGDANPRPQPYGNKTNYYGVRAPIPGGTSTSRAATPVGHGQTQWWAQQPPCAQRGPYETSGNGFSATAHCEAVASAGSGFGAHGQYQFYNQQPPFEADDADGYSRSAWARLRTPSPKCFHRGFDRGWLDGGSAPAWSDASASVPPYAPKPRREPAPMQPAATVRHPADVQVPYNDVGMRGGDLGRAAPPPTARVATSPVQEVDKSVQFFDHSREVDAAEEDCTATKICHAALGGIPCTTRKVVKSNPAMATRPSRNTGQQSQTLKLSKHSLRCCRIRIRSSKKKRSGCCCQDVQSWPLGHNQYAHAHKPRPQACAKQLR